MVALKVIAYVCFALAAVAMADFFSSEDFFLVSIAGGLVVSGVLFLALNRIVELLERIAGQKTDGEVSAEADAPAEPAAVRSIADIERDLDRLKPQ